MKKEVIKIILFTAIIGVTGFTYWIFKPLTGTLPCSWEPCPTKPTLDIKVLNILTILVIVLCIIFIIKNILKLKNK